MTVPGWTQDGDIHIHDGYWIEPAPRPPKGGWIVRVLDPPHPVLTSIDQARFTSLKAAKSAAIHHEQGVIRRTKIIRHATLALVGTLIMIPAFAVMGSRESDNRSFWLVIGLAVLLLVLRELVNLSIFVLAQGWDFAYETPKVSRLDRLVADIATAIRKAPEVSDRTVPDDHRSVYVVDVDQADPRRSKAHGP